MMRLLVPSLLLAGLSAGGALAAPVPIGILPIETVDSRGREVAAPEVEAAGLRVRAALQAAAEAHPDFDEKGPLQMNVEEARVSFSCFEEAAACMAQVAEVLEVGVLVWGRLSQDASSFTLRLRMLDPAHPEAMRDESARIAKGGDAVGRLEELAASFVRGDALDVPPLTALQVHSTPPGAEIMLDGAVVGVTPAEVLAEPGAYMLELRHPDHEPARQALSVTRAPQTLEIILGEAPPPAMATAVDEPGARDRIAPSGRRIPWAAITTGAVAVAAGGAWIYFGLDTLDQRDQAKMATAKQQVPIEEDFDRSKLLANVSMGVTIAAGAATAYLLIFQDDGPDRAGAVLSPTPGGFALSGRF